MFPVVIKNIYAVNKINIPKQTKDLRKNRECFALTFKKAGKTYYRTQKNTYQSDNTSILLLSKGISYEVEYSELGECIMIEFDADFTCLKEEISIFKLSNNTIVLDCLEKMEQAWTFKQVAYRSNSFSLLYKIFYILEKAQTTKYIPSEKYKIIKPAIDYLERRYFDEELTIDTMAEQANISPSYFRQIFSLVFMMTPSQYLRSLRLGKAKELLLTDGITITDVSDMVGFSNASYFSLVFKKETGYTPTEYMRIHRFGSK